MLQMYTEVSWGRVTQESTSIVFDNKSIQTDCTVSANEPMNKRTLRRVDVYLVQFNAIISDTTSSSEFIGIYMERDGIAILETHTGATSSYTSDLVDVSFSTLVRVKPSCCSVGNTTRLQFKVTGAEALVYFVNVVIELVFGVFIFIKYMRKLKTDS